MPWHKWRKKDRNPKPQRFAGDKSDFSDSIFFGWVLMVLCFGLGAFFWVCVIVLAFIVF